MKKSKPKQLSGYFYAQDTTTNGLQAMTYGLLLRGVNQPKLAFYCGPFGMVLAILLFASPKQLAVGSSFDQASWLITFRGAFVTISII